MKARAEDLIRDKLAGDPSADASPDAEDGRVAPDAATAQPERVAAARRDGEPGPANGPGDETTSGDDDERDDA